MKHPVGGQVLISGPSAALMARTLRGATVQRMMKEVELALEQCVLDVLLQSDDWLEAAISWRAKHDGPLGRGLPARPILKTAGGTPVSLGKLWELTQADPLPVVAWGLGEPEVENVLSVTSLERKLLKRLKIPLKDVTEELQAKAKIQTDRLKRKLSSLTVVYAAPIRRQVGSDGFSGELVLLASPTDLPKIRLAKEQIAISDWVHLPLGVHGVLNHDELAVDETWTKFNLTESLRRKMLAEVEGLYELLLTKIPKLSTRERVWASHHALNQWRHHGITSPSHLATLTGPARGLADAPLFETARGEWVPLSALASQYEKSGAIPVMNDGADDEAFADLLILRDGERYGWHVVNELASVFGQRLFKRYGSAEDLKRVLEEADPLDGTEQKRSLVRLRRLAKMLAGPLFGRLGAEELKEIRVHRGKKSVPVDYDAQRGTALLNLSTPCVAKALETASAHPERLYVLLLSLYGAVNRELEHITDEDEARLSTALLAHLAQNENALKAAE